MSRDIKIIYTPIVFPDNTQPNGALSPEPGAQACFYFYLQAQKMKELVGQSTEDQFGLYDDELWMDKRYAGLARVIAQMYSLESPSAFAAYWREVQQECFVLGLPTPHQDYMGGLKPQDRIS